MKTETEIRQQAQAQLEEIRKYEKQIHFAEGFLAGLAWMLQPPQPPERTQPSDSPDPRPEPALD